VVGVIGLDIATGEFKVIARQNSHSGDRRLCNMKFEFREEEERFRQEVQAFLEKEVTENLIREIRTLQALGPLQWEFIRKLGAKGWLNPAWPKRYGGLGLSYVYTFIIHEEIVRRGAMPGSEPGNFFGAFFVGPTILLYGSEGQKDYFLSRIAKGEIEFALGYTEPESGSDLASVQLCAVEQDGDYVLNGQKMFPTTGMYAQYIFTLARTDPNVPKHKGLSLFLVDLQSPGIERRPLHCVGGHLASQIFFDDVRVPVANLLGEKNRGWNYLMSALDLERVALSPIGCLERVFNQLVEYVKETTYEDKPLAKDSIVRQKLAQIAIEIEAVRVLKYRAVSMIDNGLIPVQESAMLKVFHGETSQRLVNAAMEIVGFCSQLKADSNWAPLQGELERLYRHSPITTIGAGTVEIDRNIIAIRGLGLPT
jgi:alkylation response protein AidB-like acyl-CoA dehydrogenase